MFNNFWIIWKIWNKLHCLKTILFILIFNPFHILGLFVHAKQFVFIFNVYYRVCNKWSCHVKLYEYAQIFSIHTSFKWTFYNPFVPFCLAFLNKVSSSHSFNLYPYTLGLDLFIFACFIRLLHFSQVDDHHWSISIPI